MANLALDFSNDLATAVRTAAASIVRVIGGRRDHGRTGTVWRGDGLVVTSAHRLGDDVAVVTGDGTRLDAEVVGRDRGTDVAVLRVDADDLEPIVWRDTDDLSVGNAALALGRPGRSVRASLRIIGVLADDIRTPGGGVLERYVETDRRIPPGFAGGPLVDPDGKAIGMSSRRAFRGADLAVPHVTLARVVAELEKHGTIPRGYLGVASFPVALPPAIAAQRGHRRGALVVAVEEGSAAEAAGLYLGDVLVAIDGDPIRGPRDLRDALLDRADTQVTVTVLRAGAINDVRVEVGHRGSA